MIKKLGFVVVRLGRGMLELRLFMCVGLALCVVVRKLLLEMEEVVIPPIAVLLEFLVVFNVVLNLAVVFC